MTEKESKIVDYVVEELDRYRHDTSGTDPEVVREAALIVLAALTVVVEQASIDANTEIRTPLESACASFVVCRGMSAVHRKAISLLLSRLRV